MVRDSQADKDENMGRNKDDFSKSLPNNHVAEYDNIGLIEDRLANNMFDLPKIDSSDLTRGSATTNFKQKNSIQPEE
jgi:hypothetical protein